MKKSYSLHVYCICVPKTFLCHNVSMEFVNVIIMSHYANMQKFHICYLLIVQMSSGRSNTGRKRQIPNIGSSAMSYDEHGFKSFFHEQYYTKSKTRNLIQEKTTRLEDLGEWSDVVQEIN